jgi:hypothetical protein
MQKKASKSVEKWLRWKCFCILQKLGRNLTLHYSIDIYVASWIDDVL